jgi:hypothetical protein
MIEPTKEEEKELHIIHHLLLFLFSLHNKQNPPNPTRFRENKPSHSATANGHRNRDSTSAATTHGKLSILRVFDSPFHSLSIV